MINVRVCEKNDSIVLIEIKGHAEFAEYGKDIVCAGVSSIIGGLNALDHPERFDIKINNGYVFLEKMQTISKHDRVVIETMVTQLETIKDSYKDYISIRKEKLK